MRSVLIALVLTGCATPSVVVINGTSHHFIKEGSDKTNHGVGLRYGAYEASVYDNSRVKESYSYYGQRRVYRNGKFFVDAGFAWYDGKNGYKPHVVPILNAGVKVGVVEAGLAVPDIANVRIVIDSK